MGHVKYLSLVVLITWSAFSAGAASGQIVYGQPASAKLRVIYTSWETSEDGDSRSLGQLYVPF